MTERGDDKTVQFGSVSRVTPSSNAETVRMETVSRKPDGNGLAPSTPPAATVSTTQSDSAARAESVSKPRAESATHVEQTAPPRATMSRKRIMLVAIAAAVVVGGAAAAVVLALGGGGDGKPQTEEQRLDEAIRNYFAVLSGQGPKAATALSCREIRDLGASLPPDAKQSVTVAHITDINIVGNRATAKVTGHSHTEFNGQVQDLDNVTSPIAMQLEGGTWRMCTPQE